MPYLASRKQKNAWAAFGALIALAAAVFFAWRWTGSLEGQAAPVEIAMDASTPAPTVAPTTAPTLVDVLDVPEAAERSEPAQRSQRRDDGQASAATPAKQEKLAKDAAEKRSERLAAAAAIPKSIRCNVTPAIETHRVPDLNYGRPMTLSVIPLVGATASTTGLIESRPTLSFPLKLSGAGRREVQLVVDHPDAMRTIKTVRRWGSDGAEMSATPTVLLRPIGCRVELGRMPIVIKKDRIKQPPSWFSGTASLVSLEADGGLKVIDSVDVTSKSGRRTPLRYAQWGGEILILGTPSSETAAADLIDLSKEVRNFPSDGSVLKLPAGLRGRTPTPIQFDVLDPFGELLKEATVTATVNEDYVARRTRHRTPVRFGEFVFVKEAGPGNGQLVSGDAVHDVNLGLARATASGTSGANGRVALSGIDARVYQFTVKSPFGDTAPTESPVTNMEGPQNTVAPMAGIEVHCPVVWRTDDAGRAAWARAKVKLSGRSKMLPFSKADGQARQPRRFLVPADREITIRCEAKGTPKMVQKIRGPGQRQTTAHFPAPPKKEI